MKLIILILSVAGSCFASSSVVLTPPAASLRYRFAGQPSINFFEPVVSIPPTSYGLPIEKVAVSELSSSVYVSNYELPQIQTEYGLPTVSAKVFGTYSVPEKIAVPFTTYGLPTVSENYALPIIRQGYGASLLSSAINFIAHRPQKD